MQLFGGQRKGKAQIIYKALTFQSLKLRNYLKDGVLNPALISPSLFKKCLSHKAVSKKKLKHKLSSAASSSSLSFHFYCWCLSIGLGDRSGACLQFSCGFNWSLVGRSVWESVCEWVRGDPECWQCVPPLPRCCYWNLLWIGGKKLVRTSSLCALSRKSPSLRTSPLLLHSARKKN